MLHSQVVQFVIRMLLMHVISMVWQWHLQDLDYSITKKHKIVRL